MDQPHIQVNQIVLEKRDLITQTTSEEKALGAQNSATEVGLTEKESEVIQSEAGWKIKLTAVEEPPRRTRASTERRSSEHGELARKTDKEKAQITKEEKRKKK
ncbi:hypothetical protein EYF80_009756 [Liparis tanakae]|uniref:Uncharacterized protein n=1 Tax=Liparis tanakae TaxID=230148 RepID=A0A4Z2IPJ4_9TELE|nr:hypothetical protein EYF80_009756 [Liparis tanakae]